MKFEKYTQVGQINLIPSISITYDKTLWGGYEIGFVWLNVWIGIQWGYEN